MANMTRPAILTRLVSAAVPGCSGWMAPAWAAGIALRAPEKTNQLRRLEDRYFQGHFPAHQCSETESELGPPCSGVNYHLCTLETSFFFSLLPTAQIHIFSLIDSHELRHAITVRFPRRKSTPAL